MNRITSFLMRHLVTDEMKQEQHDEAERMRAVVATMHTRS